MTAGDMKKPTGRRAFFVPVMAPDIAAWNGTWRTLPHPTSTYGKHEARLGGLRCNRSNLIRTGDVEPREDAQSDHFCA
jgi:hypothetical protein